MGSGHSHALPSSQNERKLWIALALTSMFLVAEAIGGVLTRSLALISDAAHMLTDAAALAVALAAIRIARRAADRLRTFGYYRFEILAAALNALLLFAVGLYILFEAYHRLKNPPEIHSLGMLVIASFGLVVNLISMRLLSSGRESSLNLKGAYLEVWSDMLGSAGVIVAAITIWLTGWTWVDSLVAAAIGLWVLPRTWTLLKESINILLQGVPQGFDLGRLDTAIRAIPGVQDIHNLHVWSLTTGRNVLSAHVVVDPAMGDGSNVMRAVTEIADRDFEIAHSTVQIERTRGFCAPSAGRARCCVRSRES